MAAAPLALLALLALAAPAGAETEVCAPGGPTVRITTPTSWPGDGSPYLVGCSVVLEDRLDVGAGAEVRFTSAGARISIEAGGSLHASSDPLDPIRFTSLNQTPGAWGGIHAWGAASTSELDGVVLEYGGADGALLRIDGGFRLKNAVVRASAATGVLVQPSLGIPAPGPLVVLTDVRIEDNPLGMDVACCGGRLVMERVTFRDNAATARTEAAHVQAFNGMAVEGTTQAVLNVTAGTLVGNHTWAAPVPYSLGRVELGNATASAHLTVAPGSTLRARPPDGGFGAPNSTGITALGTGAQPILFTTDASPPARGSWRELPLGSGRAEHVTVEWGNGASVGGNGTVRDSVIRQHAGRGLLAAQDALVERVVARDNGGDGVAVVSSAGGVVVRDSLVAGNGGAGIRVPCCGLPSTVTGNRLEGNALAASAHANATRTIAGNTYAGNLREVIEVAGTGTFAEVLGNHTWAEPVPYAVQEFDIGRGGAGTPANARWGNLTLAPGTVVLMGPGGSIEVELGSLVAAGTQASPIAFLGDGAQPAPGAWAGLLLSNTSRLEHAEVAHAGAGGKEAVRMSQASLPLVKLANLTLRDNAADGLVFVGGSARVEDNRFLRNGGRGLFFPCCVASGALPVVQRNLFEGNGRSAEALAQFAGGFHNNSYLGNAQDGILLNGSSTGSRDGKVDAPAVWDEAGTTYDLPSNVTFAGGSDVRLAAGTHLRLGKDVWLSLKSDSKVARLNVTGEAGRPVTFSRLDPRQPWDALRLDPTTVFGVANGQVAIRNATFDGGGSRGAGMLVLNTSGHRVERSTFHGSQAAGVEVRGNTNTVAHNRLLDNAVGLRVSGSSNKAFDNEFRNALNAQDTGTGNSFHTPKRAGPNIRGGPFISGNWWHDYCGTDTNQDGLADAPLPHRGDWAPLVMAPTPAPHLSLAPVANLNQTGRFHANASTDPLGRAIAHASWSFGDGANASGLDVAHAYTRLGPKSVVLRLSADGCEWAQAIRTLGVTDVLQASLAVPRDTYGPHEAVEALAHVRFQNGEPVAGAALAFRATHAGTTGKPGLDAALADAGWPGEAAWGAETGPDGTHAAAVPWFVAQWSKGTLPGLLNAPGDYGLAMAAAWGGNAGAAGDAWRVEAGEGLPRVDGAAAGLGPREPCGPGPGGPGGPGAAAPRAALPRCEARALTAPAPSRP